MFYEGLWSAAMPSSAHPSGLDSWVWQGGLAVGLAVSLFWFRKEVYWLERPASQLSFLDNKWTYNYAYKYCRLSFNN